MFKVCFVWIVVFPLSCFADGLMPAGYSSPIEVLQAARSDKENGRYRDALEKYVWFHENATKVTPSLSGVRLSYALSDWIVLGKVYPPALDKMKQLRDRADTEFRTAALNGERLDVFRDFVALNAKLQDPQRTVETFKWLVEVRPASARRVYQRSLPHLLEMKEYALCEKYVDPDRDLDRLIILYNAAVDSNRGSTGKMLSLIELDFIKDVVAVVDILVRGDRTADAQRVARNASEFFKQAGKYTELKEALRAVLEGQDGAINVAEEKASGAGEARLSDIPRQ